MVQEEGEEKQAIHAQIESAVLSRLQHFKDQADSLTLEGVRRLLEKDLGLEKYALDAHKRFIRQYLEQQMDNADGHNSKKTVENPDKEAHLSEKEATESPKEHGTKEHSKEAKIEDEEKMEDSPVMGLLTKKSEVDTEESVMSENRVKKAIWERGDHFLANSENITLAGVRRLLEEDLGLHKNALDPFKKFISEQIDQVLNSPRVSKSANHVKKKNSENSQNKKSKKITSGEGSHSSDGESDEEEDKVKLRKKVTPRTKDKKLDGTNKRKRSNKESDSDVSGKKQNKLAKRLKEEDSDSDNDGSVSEDSQSKLSVEKPVKRKEQPTPLYGKQVEHLKSIIKSCGMSVAPTVYKKAKQVPDNKREAFIVKELERILSREGLSSNPSEKEIKDCRRRKERAKELEGIDMINIISSSRRRSTSSYMAPKPKIETAGNKTKAKASKCKDNNDKDAKGDNEEEKEEKEKEKEKEKDEDEEEGEEEEEEEGEDEEEEEEVDDSQSEDFNEDDEESS